MLGIAGYDFCVVDTEHAAFSQQDLVGIIRASELYGVSSIIRTSGLDRGEILHALDSGAYGVQVPNIDTCEQARELVAASLYAPLGERGFSPTTRAAGYGTIAPSEYPKIANENIMTVAHCESRTGAANLDAILQVENLDAVFIGPMDMSQSFGLIGQTDHPEVKACIEGAIKKIHAAGKFAGIICKPGKVAYYRDLGISYFLLGGDQGFMASAAKNALSAACEQCGGSL
jgi:4-hydroxy-2-oxoheptanedioate aldolase